MTQEIRKDYKVLTKVRETSRRKSLRKLPSKRPLFKKIKKEVKSCRTKYEVKTSYILRLNCKEKKLVNFL